MAKRKKNRPKIRFAVGSPEEPFSPAWVVAAHRSNVYISGRELGGVFKVSLHLESEVWVGAFTSESEATPGDSGTNRRVQQWTRPPEFAPGWTPATGILIPRLDDKHDLPVRQGLIPPNVTWLPTPRVGNGTQVMVLLASNRELRPSNEIVLGHLLLSNGETLWVVGDERPIADGEKSAMLDIRDRELGIAALGGMDVVRRGREHGAIIWITTSPDQHCPMLAQITVGSHNFDAPLLR